MAATAQGDATIYAAMPIGILQVDVRRAWELIGTIPSEKGAAAAQALDQNMVCGLVNATDITRSNEAARHLLSLGGGDLSGPLAVFLPEETRQLFASVLLRLRDGHQSFSSEARLKRGDGAEIHVILSAWPATKDARPDEICLGLVDISQRVSIEEAKDSLQGEIAHAARIAMLGEMTASIAHEVNQPLSSIVTNAEAGLRWLDRDEPDIAEVKALLERIVRNGKRAADIISTMRSMARNTKPERKPASVNALVEEAVLLLRSELTKRQVALRLELAPDLPEASIDRTQILQVIVNLALNAAQAMADGHAWNRMLAIRTRHGSGKYLTVEVEDTGPGVDPEVRDRLFERFYTTKETGIGIGLAICRSIIEAHDSRIELQSSPHQGARFSFGLPIVGRSELPE